MPLCGDPLDFKIPDVAPNQGPTLAAPGTTPHKTHAVLAKLRGSAEVIKEVRDETTKLLSTDTGEVKSSTAETINEFFNNRVKRIDALITFFNGYVEHTKDRKDPIELRLRTDAQAQLFALHGIKARNEIIQDNQLNAYGAVVSGLRAIEAAQKSPAGQNNPRVWAMSLLFYWGMEQQTGWTRSFAGPTLGVDIEEGFKETLKKASTFDDPWALALVIAVSDAVQKRGGAFVSEAKRARAAATKRLAAIPDCDSEGYLVEARSSVEATLLIDSDQ